MLQRQDIEQFLVLIVVNPRTVASEIKLINPLSIPEAPDYQEGDEGVRLRHVLQMQK